MRKEGVLFLVIGSTLLLGGANYYQLFNLFAFFILAGIIPGTTLSIPEGFMFSFSLAALLAVIGWPLRDKITAKIERSLKATKQLQPKSKQA